MDDGTDMAARSVLGLPAWIQTRRQARLAFLLVGAWTCAFACVSMLTVFHAGWTGWTSKLDSVLLFTSVGAALGSIFAIPILWRSDVRRSVPFTWGCSVLVMVLAIVFESPLSRSSALLWLPWIAMVAGMFVARRLFPWPRDSRSAH